MTKPHIVYGIFREERLRYVGLTGGTLAARMRGHRKAIKRHKSIPLYCAFRKYGLDAFTFKILEQHPSRAAAEQAERRLIAENRETLLNVTAGGDGLDSETARRIGGPHIAAAARKLHADPNYKAIVTARLKAVTSSPDFPQLRSADMKRRHAADPTLIERIKAANRAHHARNPGRRQMLGKLAAVANLRKSIARIEDDPSIAFAHPTINGRQLRRPRAEALAIMRARLIELEKEGT